MLARGDYKYVRTLVSGETEELYDISSDPAELINLAAESKHQDRLRQMRRQAVDELRRTDAGFVEHLPAVAIQPAFFAAFS